MSQLWVLESEDGAVTATAAGSLGSLGTGELRWSLSREACGAEQLDTILTVCTVSKHTSSSYCDVLLQREEFTCHSDGACVSMSERWAAVYSPQQRRPPRVQV